MSNDEPHSQKKVQSLSQPTGTKLPQAIQDNLDNEARLWDVLYEGNAPDSTDTSARYAAYAARARTILRAAHRYIAYTSDVGESFRPVAHPFLVRGAYAVSWAYLAGDVANEGRKAYVRNQEALAGLASGAQADPGAQHSTDPGKVAAALADAAKDVASGTPKGIAPIDDYRAVMAQRAVFQSIASMGLPAFTIHSVVRYSGRALKNTANKSIRTYGPIGLGLAAVPFLPFIFDEPVEKAVEWTFHKGFEAVGGKAAVGGGASSSKKEL